MINLNKYNKQLVSKEGLLEHLNESDVFRYYTGQPVNLVGNMKSPLRKDESPSFGYFISESGEVCFNDFVLGGGDFVKLVSIMFNLNFYEALCKIATDFELEDKFIFTKMDKNAKKAVISESSIKLDTTKKSIINKRSRPFEVSDLKYWMQYNIDYDTLIKYNVSPIDFIFINSKIYKADKYAYCFTEFKDKETFKIYQPFNKNMKWLNTHNESVWQGWEQLPPKGHTLIITKSLKDVMSIVNSLDIPAVSLQAESVKPKSYVMEDLKERFTQIYVLYDNDYDAVKNWGRILGKKLATEYLLKQIEIPEDYESKDFSDLVKNKGVDTAIKVLKKLL